MLLFNNDLFQNIKKNPKLIHDKKNFTLPNIIKSKMFMFNNTYL